MLPRALRTSVLLLLAATCLGFAAVDDENGVVRGKRPPTGRLSFSFSQLDPAEYEWDALHPRDSDFSTEAPVRHVVHSTGGVVLPNAGPHSVLGVFAGGPLECGLTLDFVPLRRADFANTAGLRLLPLQKGGPVLDLRVSRLDGDKKAVAHNLGAANWEIVPWRKETPGNISTVHIPLVYAGNVYGREIAPPGKYRIDLRLRLALLGSDGEVRTVDCTAAPLFVEVWPAIPCRAFYDSWMRFCTAAVMSSWSDYLPTQARQKEIGRAHV